MSSPPQIAESLGAFPMELYGEIYSHAQGQGEDPRGDKDIIRTSQVCERWRADKQLQTLRGRASAHFREPLAFVRGAYPERLRQLFRECHLAIVDLSLLDATSIRHSKPYTDDFITFIDPSDMRFSVMRFTDSLRPGIAFLLRATDPLTGQSIDRVLTIFKRIQHFDGIDEKTDLLWAYAWSGGNQDIQLLIENSHTRYIHPESPDGICPTCPFLSAELIQERDLSILSSILRNQHPVCTLPGHVAAQPLALQAPAPRPNRFSARTIFITVAAIAALAWIINCAFVEEVK